MRSRSYRTVFAVLAVMGIAACTRAPQLGAPEGSFTPATFKVKVADTEDTVAGAAVTPQFFAAVGSRAQLGRAFSEPDFVPAAAGVAILNHRYWTERLQSDPGAIGTAILVDGRRRVIVGVAPPAFQPEGAGLIWIPKNP